MSKNSNLDALVARVVAKARDEAKAMTERAEKGAAREVRQAEEQASQRLEAAEAALREAARQKKRSVLAEIQYDERRALMNKREEAVETVFAAALKQLGQIDDEEARRTLLVRLIAEAVEALGVDAARVRLNDAELALVRQGEFPDRIGGASIAVDDETIACCGGPVVSDVAGRVVFENTFEARLERMRGDLRGQVAQCLALI